MCDPAARELPSARSGLTDRLSLSSIRCESCIERIFNLGPAPCPTCGVLNRKSGFGGQTFEDLKVEEEVDIRRRVARE